MRKKITIIDILKSLPNEEIEKIRNGEQCMIVDKNKKNCYIFNIDLDNE